MSAAKPNPTKGAAIEQDDAAFGPVEKLRWLAAAAGQPDLNRVDLALLVTLADMINSASGEAWPSYATLADRTGSTVRHVKRVIRALVDRGLVVVVRPGNRVRSNRYALNRRYFTTKGGGDTQDTRVVSPVSSCGDTQVSDVVTHRPPESIHQSEHQARIEMDRSQADEGQRPSAPGGLPGSPGEGQRRDLYPDFWEALGRRTTVADAEQLLREALAAGADYQDIVEGAKRYRHYCEQTGSGMRMSAAAWVRGEKWRDDWQPPTARASASSPKASPKASAKAPKGKGRGKAKGPAKAKGTATTTPTGRPRQRQNPDWKRWHERREQAAKPELQAMRELGAHFGACGTCKRAAKQGDRDRMCSQGKPLLDAHDQEREALRQWNTENPEPERWLLVTEE